MRRPILTRSSAKQSQILMQSQSDEAKDWEQPLRRNALLLAMTWEAAAQHTLGSHSLMAAARISLRERMERPPHSWSVASRRLAAVPA